ncbi:hypothetical protein GVO57_09605 [Sphingomonas changnyeongensis]|uniref:Holin-X, holin superfamily III n=1 Tax=Sphingomonas changnyeongensis TaxID=2698679 RepID=A0A7Z2NWA7_9SPHN|nr:phage holin family protein [Sphingomonas changnyeongensis]QHL91028.1 hypothetical protein GVO57_09605 [Sphingomonas changnyeongensis]
MNEDVPIGELIGQLVEDGKAFARAEAGLYRARARAAATPLLRAAVLAGLALALALGTVPALLVGLVLVLQPVTGTGAALTIVIAGALLAAAGLGYLAWRQIRRAGR